MALQHMDTDAQLKVEARCLQVKTICRIGYRAIKNPLLSALTINTTVVGYARVIKLGRNPNLGIHSCDSGLQSSADVH